ncbi:MAG: 1-acyl-sn-glycerol-3-phosphate acyltransferase [Flavisolibacter sp.]|nr:1-acyl-sn-glycerol-3-phosphate acyltransferase [Flavisolibacter sp.]MBD0377101.1 1-acyl-sn-glycerol-3-phosphate acyltransferase [Flavisolibacter sp.]
MLFGILKIYARLAIKIYCRKIIINKPEWLKAKGPLLLACNHPNSFLDGIILTTLFEENIYSLARGDAFQKRYDKLLRWLHLLPVYRTSEGVENLSYNYTTFAVCQEVFARGGLVIIFSEAGTKNEWRLRPLKKGTARLAISTWQKGIDLKVVPVGLNYNTFRNFGKNVFINFGEPLDKEAILQHTSDGLLFSSFNEQLKEQLQALVYEINPADKKKMNEKLFIRQPLLKRILLALPALLGLIVHAPLYFAAKWITKIYFDNDHFDAVVASLLTLSYPLYLLLFCITAEAFFNGTFALGILFLMPFSAWTCVQLKNQLD